MKSEIWKPIEGYEGVYEVSNLGNVKSLNYARTKKPNLLTQHADKDGYMKVTLYKKTGNKLVFVHRLVAKAFIPNPNNFPLINHKDEIKSNNSVENLEWCTLRYNYDYGTGVQRRTDKLSMRIVAILPDGAKEYYPSQNEAARQLKCSQACISECINGKQHTAQGRVWEEISEEEHAHYN